ncbi:DNA primase [Clostridiaceae bacterium HSG29]|nr:DNA primase [Clostridiaceae bacterium HSG29]
MSKRYIQGIDKIIMDNVDIVDFLSRYMILKKSGKNYKGLCPFHNEKTPSFFVSTDEQLYNCFGCEAGGSVITFVSEMENLEFIDTIEFIAEAVNLDLSSYIENSEDYSTEYKEKDEIIKLNRDAAIYYYKNLRASEDALTYLSKRKIDKNIIKIFGLGYVSNEWNGVMDYLLQKGYEIKLIYKAGLVSRSEASNKYYDKFRGRVMFPIFNVKGKIIAFGGRIIEKKDNAPKYLNSPETLVFNKSETLYGLNIARKNIRNNEKLILVEGYMDVIMLHKYGIKNAVAALGTSFTNQHAKIIKRYVNELIICFDSDTAGLKATYRAIKNIGSEIDKVKVIELEKGYDPDDFIKKNGADAFNEKIKNAKASHLFLIDKLQEPLDLTKEYDLHEFIVKSKEILKDIKDYSIQNYYTNIIAKRIEMSPHDIMSELFDPQKKSVRKHVKQVENNKINNDIENKDSDLQLFEKKLLQFVLIDKKFYLFLISQFDFEKFNTESILNIFRFLENYYHSNNEFVLEKAYDYLEIYESKLCSKLINNKIISSDPERDMKLYIEKLRIELLKKELNELKIYRKNLKNSKEIENIILREESIKREIRNMKALLES